MRPAGRGNDTTWQAVASKTLGDDLLLKVLSEVVDTRERAVLFAHVALDLPVAALARTLGQEREEVKALVNRVLDRLKADEDLYAVFTDVHRAGHRDHYLSLAVRLGLQDWFCASCERFMIQPAVGRPRVTCSDVCRKRRLRGRAGSQQDFEDPGRVPALRVAVGDADSVRDVLRIVIAHLDVAADAKLMPRETAIRNKAIILLGATCPIDLSPAILASFSANDVIETRKGLDVLLRQSRHQAKRYVTVPPDQDRAICPVRGLRAWRDLQRKELRQTGTLFQQLKFDEGRLDTRASGRPLIRRTVASIIQKAVSDAGLNSAGQLHFNDSLPFYFRESAAGAVGYVGSPNPDW
jgi:hypothetical protein